MKIEKTSFQLPGILIPAVHISSPDSHGSALVMHGYGGNKEEQLGLCFRIAEYGFDAWAIDLRGHGENPCPLGMAMLDDVNAIVAQLAGGSQPVVTIGHSLGGRISLLSAAKFRVGISPAASREYSEQTKQFIKHLRQYRVREETPDANFDILEQLPLIEESFGENDFVVYGSRDVHDVLVACERLKSRHPGQVKQIKDALHGDIFLVEETFEELKKYLEGIS